MKIEKVINEKKQLIEITGKQERVIPTPPPRAYNQWSLLRNIILQLAASVSVWLFMKKL